MLRLSRETIAVQIKDPIVDELTSHFDLIKKRSKMFERNKEAFKDSVIENLFKSIDSIILKRFGIRTKHLYNRGNYGILPVPPGDFTIFNSKMLDEYKSLSSKLAEKPVKKADELKDLTNESGDVTVHIKRALDGINSVVDLERLTVDRGKAFIGGLPEDYIVFLGVDLIFLTKNIDITPRELTAILLHEIGHAFTYIEYSYRSLRDTTSILEETLSKTSSKYDGKEVLLILRNNLDKTKPLKVKNENILNVFIDTIDTFDSYLTRYDSDKSHGISSTDAEYLADMFSARFGLGSDLVTALNKISYKGPEFDFRKTFTKVLVLYVIFVFIIPSVLAYLVFASAYIIFMIKIMLEMIFGPFGEKNNNGQNAHGHDLKIYDSKRDRMVRLKNELIRQYRTNNELPREQLLKEIKNLEFIISRTKPSKDFTGLNRLLLLNGKIKDDHERSLIERDIDNLQNNDLYTASFRLD